MTKTGIFMFSDRRQSPEFDPRDATLYDSWDGCYVITLRDGSTLEEVEFISSYTGANANSRGEE